MNAMRIFLENEGFTREGNALALPQFDTVKKLTEAIEIAEKTNASMFDIMELERERDEIIVLAIMKDFKAEDLELYHEALDEIDLLEDKLKEARSKDDATRIAELERQINLLSIYTRWEFSNEECHNEMCYQAGIDIDDEPYHSTCLFDFLAFHLRKAYLSHLE